MATLQPLEGYCKKVLSRAHMTLRRLGDKGREEVKDEKVYDISTRADREISREVKQILVADRFPAVFCDEEEGVERLVDSPQYTVVLDDIDGTNNYNRGKGTIPYCTSVAIFDKPLGSCAYKDVVAAGVIEHNSSLIWLAVRNWGCREYKPTGLRLNRFDLCGSVRTSGKKEVDRKTVVAVEGYESRRQIKRFEDIFENAWVKDFGTSALELAGVACGMFDAFIHPLHKKDELPAGYLLIKEAGGCITDFAGKPIDDNHYIYEDSARQNVIAAATPELGKALCRMISD